MNLSQKEALLIQVIEFLKDPEKTCQVTGNPEKSLILIDNYNLSRETYIITFSEEGMTFIPNSLTFKTGVEYDSKSWEDLNDLILFLVEKDFNFKYNASTKIITIGEENPILGVLSSNGVFHFARRTLTIKQLFKFLIENEDRLKR